MDGGREKFSSHPPSHPPTLPPSLPPSPPSLIYNIQKHVHGAPQLYSRYRYFEIIMSHKCTIKARGSRHGMHANAGCLYTSRLTVV